MTFYGVDFETGPREFLQQPFVVDCRGLVPVEYSLDSGPLVVESASGQRFESVQADRGEWYEYDEVLASPISVTELQFRWRAL